MERYIYLLNIALEAVFINRTRSVLTALGIVFGVAAVIAMLAIGSGAKKEILEQMKQVGVNNIVITPVSDEEADDNGGGEMMMSKSYSPGLSLADVKNIAEVIPNIENISPEVIYDTYIIRNGERAKGKVTGVTSSFFEVFNHELERGGFFNELQHQNGVPVCIIGSGMKAKLFKGEKPIGKKIKCGNVWLKVVGVLKLHSLSKKASESFSISGVDENVFVPLQTVFSRFVDRSVITKNMLGDGGGMVVMGNSAMITSSGESGIANNQLDKIVVQVKSSEQLYATKKLLNKMLKRRHNDKADYKITVPELLLKQEQRTKSVFNIVLGAIASISLLVGGIGIMNIMLASVMERIKEIGIRLAIGARRSDVIIQFLTEATIISVIGGLLGIVLGVLIAKGIELFADITTIVSLVSIIISFFVSATVGIVFGIMPARKAARQDPVESLRYQ
ncbi:MAG: ABC transporter permease [Bacteroidota bacterium]|nr:ABC transporter permease [Bacteroidota bacterium]